MIKILEILKIICLLFDRKSPYPPLENNYTKNQRSPTQIGLWVAFDKNWQNYWLFGRILVKTEQKAPIISKNHWISKLAWAAEIYFWAAGWPLLLWNHLRLPGTQLNWLFFSSYLFLNTFSSVHLHPGWRSSNYPAFSMWSLFSVGPFGFQMELWMQIIRFP